MRKITVSDNWINLYWMTRKQYMEVEVDRIMYTIQKDEYCGYQDYWLEHQSFGSRSNLLLELSL